MEEQDLSFLIKKVEFSIHESFPESLITVTEAPFEIHNAGYGEFPISITIYFQDPHERPLEYTHPLKIDLNAEGINEVKTAQKKNAPIIFEKFNEITFYEPTEQFYEVLKAN
mmetsp:Transcript_33657/g.51946  ORF Transcript_33657/g.51946 Transcript_33657/m.51946 type:complete len:112 (+) Transcript_33657:210-545(+)